MRVRVGVHTGEPAVDPPKYVGVDVHRAARIMSAAHGGQVVISQSTHDLVAGEVELRDLGRAPAQGLPRPAAAVAGRRRRLPAAAHRSPDAAAADGVAAARPRARGRRPGRADDERGAGGDDHRAGRHRQDAPRDRRRARAGGPHRRRRLLGAARRPARRPTSSCRRSRRRSRRRRAWPSTCATGRRCSRSTTSSTCSTRGARSSELLAQAPRREGADDEPRGAPHHGRARLPARAARAEERGHDVRRSGPRRPGGSSRRTARSRRSACGWTACRSRSSWRPPARGCSSRSRCSDGWSAASRC